MSHATHIKIIMAADRVVQDKGIRRLTLDEVARVAEVSKGGLLYHFATKEALIQAMLEHALEAFEVELARARGSDTSPGSWLRAYIKTSFPKEHAALHEQSLVSSAVLASVGNDPILAEPYRAHLRTWVQHASEDGLEANLAQTVRLAIDALWLQDALGFPPYRPQERAALIEAMIAMTRAPEAKEARASASRSATKRAVSSTGGAIRK